MLGPHGHACAGFPQMRVGPSCPFSSPTGAPLWARCPTRRGLLEGMAPGKEAPSLLPRCPRRPGHTVPGACTRKHWVLTSWALFSPTKRCGPRVSVHGCPALKLLWWWCLFKRRLHRHPPPSHLARAGSGWTSVESDLESSLLLPHHCPPSSKIESAVQRDNCLLRAML